MTTRLRNDTFDVIDVIGDPAAIEVSEAPGGIVVVGAPYGGVAGLNGVSGIWAGNQAAYDAIAVPSPTVVYVITP